MACNISNSFTDWDLQHSFGVLNTDSNHHSQAMEETSSFFSTGYLEDAVIEWSNYCKRKRLLSYSPDDHQMVLNSKQKCGEYGDHGTESTESFRCLTPLKDNLIAESYNLFPENKRLSLNSLGDDINNSFKGTITSTTTEELDPQENISSMSSFYLNSVTKTPDGRYSSESYLKRNGRDSRKVAYPFNIVKPGGIDGDLTLNDINERILMPPTRPIKHPVGEMACYPSCVSTSGLGPSGKAIVAFTRIHTQGRGTVTIIRTRG